MQETLGRFLPPRVLCGRSHAIEQMLNLATNSGCAWSYIVVY